MKRMGLLLACGFVGALAMVGWAQEHQHGAQAPLPAFEKLKSLAGEWKGTYGEKKQPSEVAYRVVSNGTVVEETLKNADSKDMVTLYYRDGDRLMMTHYCSIGNQPRMAARPMKDGKTLVFSFVDVTNLVSPQDGHMHAMELTFDAANRITHRWTWRQAGKDTKPEVFEFTRK